MDLSQAFRKYVSGMLITVGLFMLKQSCYRRRRPLLKKHPPQVRHKQDWSRRFILLLPQTAVLPRSDAGSDVVQPASSFIIQNRRTSCSMWCPMYRPRCWNMVCGLFRGAALAIGEGARPICAWKNGIAQHQLAGD